MKNIRLIPPISKALFRFGQKDNNKTKLSTHTNWTVQTKTTTVCVFEFDTN